MNATKYAHRFNCPQCGLSIRAETASLIGVDYWRHLSGEPGMNRSIYVKHVRMN